MKIAIDCRMIGLSGIGTFIWNVVYHALDMSDIEYVLIGSRASLAPFAKKKNCRIVECNYSSFTLRELLFFPTVEVNRCDAFFTPNFNIPMGIHIPIFSTIHDVVFFDVEGICSPIGKMVRKFFMKRALKMSKLVFTVSHFSENRIRTILGTQKPIQVVYSGIHQQLEDFKKTFNESPLQEKPQENYFVFLGNLKRQKGIGTLMEAWRKALEAGLQGVKLYVIGRFDFRTKDRTAVEWIRQGEANGIVFIEDADNWQVYKLLTGARALISPSLYEGFGLPPLEALYLGTPVIISDIPVYREVYKDTPAIMFETGNSTELAQILCSNLPRRVVLKEAIKEKYNFKTVSKTILDTISKNT